MFCFLGCVSVIVSGNIVIIIVTLEIIITTIKPFCHRSCHAFPIPQRASPRRCFGFLERKASYYTGKFWEASWKGRLPGKEGFLLHLAYQEGFGRHPGKEGFLLHFAYQALTLPGRSPFGSIRFGSGLFDI